ncbi:MAG: nucleotide exchange factor GrpE [Acidobacteriota bacterium]|jgi:molecular chaperone GrpE (heat shock protein)|nr:nucleotide exchange factor GrpE [Acidobacteriota bacterium]
MDKERLEETPQFQVVDKRKFANLDELDMSEVPEEQPRYPTYVEELTARMKETERQFQEKKQQIDEEIGRARARLEADYGRKLDIERQKLALPFLEVLDNLQRAMDAGRQSGSVESLLEGVGMTAHLFLSKLQAIGVEAIPVLDQPFDPNIGQAVGMAPVTEPDRDGVVVEELQTGYTMQGQLLRPAQVRVGRFGA